MESKVSAGLLMYWKKAGQLQVFLVHPGGPFFKNKDTSVWSIPKGLQHDPEDLLETAKREFCEETGINLKPDLNFVDLGFVTYKNGKKVYAWAFENDLPENFQLKSNPSDSGWPENDRGEYFPLEVAKTKILPAQSELLTHLGTKDRF